METLTIITRVKLNPTTVKNATKNGASDKDVIREIKTHITSAIGNRSIQGAEYILGAEVVDVIRED